MNTRSTMTRLSLVSLCLVGCSSSGTGSDDGGSPNPNPDAATIHWATSCADGGVNLPAPTGAWKNVTANLAGMASECGNLAFLSSKPERDLLLVGIAQHGLWSSANGGTSWSALGAGAGSAAITNRTSSIVYDPSNPAIYYESGIYNGPGVYRTSNDGQTFTALGAINHNDMVAVDFTDPDRKTLLASGHEQAGRLMLSTDAGTSWTDLGPKLPAQSGISSGVAVLDSHTFLMGTWSWNAGDATGIYRSTDAGMSWTRMVPQGTRSAPLVTAGGAIYWALDDGKGLVRSNDHGASWQMTIAGTVAGRTPVELPDGRIVAVGNQALLVSPDCGTTWQVATANLPYQPDNFAYSPYQKAFFIRHFDCNNPVPADAVMRFDFDYQHP